MKGEAVSALKPVANRTSTCSSGVSGDVPDGDSVSDQCVKTYRIQPEMDWIHGVRTQLSLPRDWSVGRSVNPFSDAFVCRKHSKILSSLTSSFRSQVPKEVGGSNAPSSSEPPHPAGFSNVPAARAGARTFDLSSYIDQSGLVQEAVPCFCFLT